MSRAEIVDATYDAASRLNDLKARHGRLPEDKAAAVRARLAAARAIRRELAAAGEGPLDPDVHRRLLGQVRRFSEGTINDKAELFPPAAFLRNFRLGGVLRLLAREAWRELTSRSVPRAGTTPPRLRLRGGERLSRDRDTRRR
jgi:hypothetical protein